ncbi:MAG: hypothetical protein HWD85_13300 [Flavobacteriaceae bacterium]|nr:hypothetical protein [Flavobacteriaceae bacterium]
MNEIYEKLNDPVFSTQIYSKSSGNNRAKVAINKVFEKIYNGHSDISKVKLVFLQIASGRNEITLDEIGYINDKIQENLGFEANIVMDIIGNDSDDDIELQLLFTKLDIDLNKTDVDSFKIFNSPKTNINSLPLYFLEDEYSAKEMSEIISFLSDMYSEIGGDRLKIKGFSKVQIENVLEPIFY